MLQALYDYFNLFFENFITNSGWDLSEIVFSIGGLSVVMSDWLSVTLALISLIFIIVLCCLFIYRLIRLVGRLFSGGSL